MDGQEENVKERILSATIALIRREQDTDKISMRRIADAAGVAVSMVNYHYQTKSNLIETAVQRYVGTVIASSDRRPTDNEMSPAANGAGTQEPEPPSPVERMRAHLSRAARFIVENPGISRVSILRDMRNPRRDDNTSQVVEMVFGQLREIVGTGDEAADGNRADNGRRAVGSAEGAAERAPELTTGTLPAGYLSVLASIQVAAIQHMFLRAEIIRGETGLDFNIPVEREQLIDMVVQTTTGRIGI